MASSKDKSEKEQLEAIYANYCKVGFNAFEFLLDFGQLYDEEKLLINTRIVTSPTHAKEFLRILSLSIEKYESEYSPILEPE